MKRHISNPGGIGKRYRWFLTCFLTSVVLLLMAMPRLANATVFNVPAGDVAALIQAITDANTNPGADTINLAAGSTYTLTAVNNITDGENGLPSITSELTINGNGAIIERSSAGLTPAFRIFNVAAAGNLSLDDLTVRNGFTGSSDSRGGGIFNRGTLTITDSTLSGNSAVDFGGGIFISALATVNITNSTLSGNSAGSRGGGIFNDGTLTIWDSTLSGNSAVDFGGGIFNNGGTVNITNSTLSGNSADFEAGGGIFNDTGGTATITNSTLSGNSADFGGGGIFNNGILTITNSIFNNLVGGNCFNNVGGNFAADVSNLATDSTCPGFAPAVTSTELNLGALADNGGPTQTHALLPGSPAIDGADDSVCPVTDQRGVPRDLLCDIGAFEFVPAPPPPPPAQADVSISKGAVKTVKTGKSLTYTIQVTNNGPDLASTVVVNDTLPLGTTFVSLTNPGAICTPLPVGSTGTLSCSYASLTSGSSVTLTLVVKVTAKGNGTNITNTATVSAATSDPNLANNSATVTTKIGK